LDITRTNGQRAKDLKPVIFFSIFIVAALIVIFPPANTGPAVQALATTSVVTDCTASALRAAVTNGGLIALSCGPAPMTITLSTELQVPKDTIIDGRNLVTISGGNVTRVFHTANYVALTLQNLTVSNGRPLSGNGSGAAIYGGWRGKVTVLHARFEHNDGTSGNMETGGGAIFVAAGSILVVRDSVFIGNRGTQGGAINNLLSGLTVENSQFINNDSTAGGTVGYGYGGAIYTDGASEYPNDALGGWIRITGSVFRGNIAAGQGGAVQAWVYPPDQVLVSETTFDSNQVVPRPGGDAFGGALRLGNGKMTVANTTFTNNLARNQGGAVWIGENTTDVTLNNVTLVNNAATSVNGADGLGGGIMLASGLLRMNNVTMAHNHAGFLGGAIYGGGSNVTLKNTIIAHNTANNPWNIQRQCTAVLTDGGNNLQYPANNPTDPARPDCTAGIQVTDPQLNPLADNGGSTWTMALPPGSPAINAGNTATCLLTDQRGIPRPQGSSCDIGAYEVVTHLSLNPSIAFAGDSGLTLTVLGDDFGAGDSIYWNGTALATSFVDRITLQAVVSGTKLSAPANIPITVTRSSLPSTIFQILPLQGRVYLPILLTP
jgi:hypothetical protein